MCTTHLTLANSGISILPESPFEHLVNLLFLDLSNMCTIPKQCNISNAFFAGLTGLKTLILSEIYLQYKEDSINAFQPFRNLEVFDVKYIRYGQAADVNTKTFLAHVLAAGLMPNIVELRAPCMGWEENMKIYQNHIFKILLSGET